MGEFRGGDADGDEPEEHGGFGELVTPVAPGLPQTEKGDIPGFSHCPCFAEEHFQGGVESISINIP